MELLHIIHTTNFSLMDQINKCADWDSILRNTKIAN